MDRLPIAHKLILLLAEVPAEGKEDPSWLLSPARPGWLLLPVGIVVLAGLVVYFFKDTLRQKLKAVMLSDRRHRHMTILGVSLLVPAVLALSYDVLDLSEVGKMNVRVIDLFALAASGICGIALVFCHSTIIDYEDSWESIVSTAEEERDASIRAHEYALQIGGAFRKIVLLKASRVRELAESDGPIGMEALRETLDPQTQIYSLAQAAFELYKRDCRSTFGETHKLRVAYFAEHEGFLVPRYSTDGFSDACISPHNENHLERFNLHGSPHGSLAVHAAWQRAIQIVDDAEKADADLDTYFGYFDQMQRTRIRSIMVIPIADNNVVGPAQHVICLDCDKKGFFNEEKRPIAEIFAENIHDRLLYELDVQAILERVGPVNGHPGGD